MSEQVSFKRSELRVLPSYRERISKAESTEDVKKTFVYTVKHLLEDVLGKGLTLDDADIVLELDSPPHYTLSKRILALEDLGDRFNNSDLHYVICRLANSAVHRNCHLCKHPEKTNAKIRM